jgi:GNAT superfamily N-acetyltransferase
VNAAIRRAARGDEGALAELNAFVQELHVLGNPAYFKPSVHEEVSAWFRSLLEKSTVKIWIAEGDGVPVGFASTFLHERAENAFCRSRRWLEIDQIGVRPEWRRKGIARALVQVVLGAAKAESVHDVELSSWVFNDGAHEAFRRLGFTPRVVRFGGPS